MTQPDPFDIEVIEAHEAGKLKSVASKAELNRLKAAARSTNTEDRQRDIHLSAGDLQDMASARLSTRDDA